MKSIKVWVTEIVAVDRKTGKLKTWPGPRIRAASKADAEWYCNHYGLGYCKVLGEFAETKRHHSQDNLHITFVN